MATIVLGAPHEGQLDPAIGLAELIGRSRHRPALVGPILAGECAAQIRDARVDAPATTRFRWSSCGSRAIRSYRALWDLGS